MAAFFIIGFPISKLLDWLLGDEHATYLRRARTFTPFFSELVLSVYLRSAIPHC
jgi:hypothetical protein